MEGSRGSNACSWICSGSYSLNFDLGGFLTGVVLADLNSPVHPFLLGRCLWVGSKFPSCLPLPAITSFLEGTVRGLESDQPHLVRIFALAGRANWNHLRDKGDEDSSRLLFFIIPYKSRYTDNK